MYIPPHSYHYAGYLNYYDACVEGLKSVHPSLLEKLANPHSTPSVWLDTDEIHSYIPVLKNVIL